MTNHFRSSLSLQVGKNQLARSHEVRLCLSLQVTYIRSIAFALEYCCQVLHFRTRWFTLIFYFTLILQHLINFLATIYFDHYQHRGIWNDFFYITVQPFLMMIFILQFLMHFYLNQGSWKEILWSFVRKDHDTLFFTGIHIGFAFTEKTLGTCISSNRLDDFLADPFTRLLPFDIGVYNNDDDDFEFDEVYYQSKYRNMRFRRVRHNTRRHENSSAQQSVSLNHSSETPEQAILPLMHDVVVRNTDNIDRDFVCQSCHCVLRQPYQLRCGHRQCQSCLNTQNDIVHCLSCSEPSTIDEVRFDEAFQRHLECLSVLCSVCHWTGPLKLYQEHLEKTHVDGLLLCSFCNEQVEKSSIVQHYLTAKHQLLLLNIISQLRSIPMTHDQRRRIQLSQIYDALRSESTTVTLLTERLQRIQRALDLRLHNDELIALRVSAQHLDLGLSQMIAARNLCLKDRPVVSVDGLLTWKITNVGEAIYDARSERQRSIYSPEFYSSLTGYRMRSRLFLNGNHEARDTHMSIFFILMRSEYDAILEWPFHFKVMFSLLSKDDRHRFTKCVWPDNGSICFQRPRLEMNEAYGIEKFIPLDDFEKNRDQYVTDDAMFVKVEVDFLSKPPEGWSDEGEIIREGEQHTDTSLGDSERDLLSLMERSAIP